MLQFRRGSWARGDRRGRSPRMRPAWEGLEGFVVGMAEMIATASGTGLRQAESFKAFFFD